MWPHGLWRAVVTLSHWSRAVWWSADGNDEEKKNEKRRSLMSRPLLARFGVRGGVRDRARVGGWVGPLRAYLDPSRRFFLARTREQPMAAPDIRATRS